MEVRLQERLMLSIYLLRVIYLLLKAWALPAFIKWLHNHSFDEHSSIQIDQFYEISVFKVLHYEISVFKVLHYDENSSLGWKFITVINITAIRWKFNYSDKN